ncbi:NACHT, LRR and PYD domains-containing protein 12-like isoform X2 [Colossoma macropomum]|uniref:NACHT, LRR and PYD domains-containing protein 12-like isoform X2 n=1 Tax=Colossoma macropomum TaxID=42526 RepID=UPI00186510AC|nr:NACHT, LRR and PYD domains-containing protein 12-like isoform X2 [Colossoma macropomum]
MANIPQVLLNVLHNLGEKDLKLFQWKLTNGVEGFKSIPKAFLENADRSDTVDKMVASYEISGAVAITLAILKKINQNQLAEELGTNLRESSNICEELNFFSPAASFTATQTEDSVSTFITGGKQYGLRRIAKSNFKAKLVKLYEGTSVEGDYMPLEDIYTELYVIEGCTGGVNSDHEVRQVEAFYPKTEETPVKFSDIFKVQCDQNVLGAKVLTVGIAGVGKTACVHKFILDWAEENCNQDIDFILFLSFRELNLIKHEQYSLWDLLLYFHDEFNGEDVTEILKAKCRIVFILDGLDESRIPLKFQQKKITNVTEKTTLDKLITSLIKGELLPSAIIWITSRPAAASQIPRKYFDHVTEIRGFSDPQKDQYIRKRIRDQHQASRIISHIKTARSLHILCHIPVFCRISVTVLQKMLTEGKDMKNAPTTLTEMYTRFLLFQMMQKSEKYEGEQKEINTVQMFTRDKQIGALNILKLGRLAFLQLQKGQLLFYESDLKECGIDVDEALVYSGVCTQVFKTDEKIFSFVHLSFQEFLAAIYVFLTFTHEFNPLLQTTLEKIKWNLKHSLTDLHKTAVDKAMKSENGHLDLFIRFLLGLSLQSNQRLLKSLQPEMKIKEESLKDTIDYIKIKIRKKKYFEKTLNLFHCLSELKDNSLTSEIQNFLNSGDLSTQTLSSTQWSALVFVLLMSEENQQRFELKKYRPSDEGLRRLLPVVKNTRQALLDHCNLRKDSCEALASVFHSYSQLKELDLSSNDLQDSGVDLLSTGLKSSHCKLEILRLAGCNLTINSCETLCSALKLESSTLSELNLSNNILHDSGVEILSAGLKICKLETLVLEHCNLSKHSCDALASLISSDSPLRQLDLSNNDLQDSGVELLSTGLISLHCKLEVLRLSMCKLSKHSCKTLALALQSGSVPLKKLDLSNNDLQDSGVKLLFAGLTTSCCKLEKLRLLGCNLNLNACETICSALKSVNYLTELDLSSNLLQDSGVNLLSDGLKSSHCKLEILRLAGCLITDKGFSSLASALSSNPSHLKELDLAYNHLGVSGVKLLSARLKDPHCRLYKLRLSGCMVTEEGCSSLASALRSNPSHLKELDLTYNYPGDTGVDLLTARLQDPSCRLETLRMEHEGKIRIKPGLRKYACELTLDPNTAYTDLTLSEGNRKVTWVREQQSYPDHPERFDWWEQVLCRESLAGRCYWEIEWRGWDYIAVTYKGISRKGDGDDSKLGCNNKSWILICSHIGYSVKSNKKTTDIPASSSQSNRVGVYLDWVAGTLSFYSVSTDAHTLTHLHTFHSTFTEPLYAAFRVWVNSSVHVCQIKESAENLLSSNFLK